MAMFWPQLVGFVLLVFVAMVIVDGNSLQSDKDALIDLNWSGIVCTGCGVTGIDLSNFTPQTQRMLYPHFPSFMALGSLNLFGSTFSGPIPADLVQCASLGYLNLSHNILELRGGEDPNRLSC
ncbi:putative LRR receptor-like serine/threonine-protein kinase [Nymphaea thermarum]|nr:putative LRR receptor-like serine/threonine-protein kinase [Nymphaea thermarum]